jgi:GNAT superfamily N-acetyltransferase
MLRVGCVCGRTVNGEDRAAVVRAMRRHVDEQHADLGLTDQKIEDYVDAALRMGTPRPRVEAIERLEIHPLTPERQADFLRYFDYEAFADNPAWADCYCQFFYSPSDEAWGRQSAAENRAGACARIGRREMTGYLAYVDGEPAGWVNAGPRTLYPRLEMEEEARVEDRDRVGAIVCFVIAPPYRRHGLARRLLEAAVAGFRAQGLAVAEAYPLRDASRNDDAGAFHGPPSLYEAAGFRLERELKRQTVVRLMLTP